MERYVKLFLAFVISFLFVYLPIHIGGVNIDLFFLHEGLNIVTSYIIRWVFEILQLIGLIFFLKICCLWIAEFWKLK